MPRLLKIPTGVCSYCHEDWNGCKCDSFHPNIVTHTEEEVMHLTREEVANLHDFLHEVGYIDHEKFDLVHKIIQRIRRFL